MKPKTTGAVGSIRQRSRFPLHANGNTAPSDQVRDCKVVLVGKRRDGKPRYWCLEHHADATAKYGKRATKCRAAHLPPLRREDILRLDIDRYKGGVALWGAVLAVYDTTIQPMELGVHVHARISPE